MTLEELLTKSCYGHLYYAILVARFMDEDGYTTDFIYKGYAIENVNFLKYLPKEILCKGVERFEKYDGYGLDKDGRIVKVDFKIVINY